MSTKAFGGSEHGQMAPSCPRGYTYVGKVCKRMFEPLKPHSYQSAQTYCDSDQIYVPTNQDQNRVFRAVMRHLSELKKIEGIWIGVKKTPEGEWLTDRDRTVNAKNSDWAPGYPKPDFSGDCVIASSAHGFKWINTHCSDLQSTLCALTRPQCPTGYEWLPQIPDSCFRISSTSSYKLDSGFYYSSIQMAEDLCQMEHTRLFAVGTLDQANALRNWAEVSLPSHQVGTPIASVFENVKIVCIFIEHILVRDA
ncbi:uncharacterized protein LOC131890927 [Tigriopus californicus]|uniref:uncharacterized protein LOC131890927 n=1 Tax=Tigriopus californicus TaxID=6832 RepID=UPI0027DA43EC|nr:uncharacterized protein LOC131890927 [Tigriopus californicus]